MYVTGMVLIMNDFSKLEELLLNHHQILSGESSPGLKNIGGLEELNSLPTQNIGGLEELNSLPVQNIGGLEELNSLPTQNIGGLEELNACLQDIIDCSDDSEPDSFRYGRITPETCLSSGLQLPAFDVPKPEAAFIPKSAGSERRNYKDTSGKPLSMSKLSKEISQKVPLVSCRKLLYYYDSGIYKPCLQADFFELLWEKLSEAELAKYNLPNFKNAYTFITSYPDIIIDSFPVYEYCAVCNDLLVNLANGECREICPSDLVTSRINANFIPSGNTYTPVFDEFLVSISNGDERLERLICEVIGWCCTLPNNSRKVFFVLGYAPDSGKSVIGNFLEMLYGEDLVSHVPIGDMGTRFGASPIIGKAINISMDLPVSALNSTAVSAVKMLTGGDGLSIDIKYMPQIQYKQPLHLIFASNHPIKLTEYDDAFYKRMVFVPFNNSVPYEQQDPELLEKLSLERDGIVTKCLLAVRDMLCAGRSFSCEPYKPSEYCNNISPSDSIKDYVSENIIISHHKADELSTSEMYANYCNWCGDNNLSPEAQCKFSSIIQDVYDVSKRKKHTSVSNIWVFVGVRYRTS